MNGSQPVARSLQMPPGALHGERENRSKEYCSHGPQKNRTPQGTSAQAPPQGATPEAAHPRSQSRQSVAFAGIRSWSFLSGLGLTTRREYRHDARPRPDFSSVRLKLSRMATANLRDFFRFSPRKPLACAAQAIHLMMLGKIYFWRMLTECR